MASQAKFLILNPSPNNIENIIKKGNIQNSKNGPFEAIFLLGDAFPNGSEVPKNDVEASTYFAEGVDGLVDIEDNDQPEGLSVSLKENLNCLKSEINIVKSISGITTVFLSAKAVEESNQAYVKEEILKLEEKVDILITYDWPYAIAKQEELTLVGNKFIDEVVKLCQPKYHFAVGNDTAGFFENRIFKWENGDFSRFISLGIEGGGEKWFYAFNISQASSTVQDNQLGRNPFIEKLIDDINQKRSLEVSEEITTVKKPKTVSPDKCFFCLSNPKVETHMIVSIGSYSYLTVAKGPLTRASKDLPFSGHAIIIPIEHIPTIRSLSSDVKKSPIYKEINEFKVSLVKAFSTNKPFYKLIFFEINRSTNIHQHVQVLPIPEILVEKFESDLEEKAKINNESYQHNHKLNFQKFSDDNDPKLLEILNESDYIVFTLYPKEDEKIIYISELHDSSKSIDLQFPRRVLSYTLKCPKRTYWEKCQQPKHREARECDEFKAFFKDNDFTINN